MISILDKAMFLKDIDIFSAAATEDLLRVAALCEEVCFRAGETLFRQGDPGDALYLVIEGRVELLSDGSPRASVLPRGSVGSYAILNGEARYFTAVASTDVCALRMDALDFMDYVSDNGRIALGMLRHLASKATERAL